MFYLKVFVSERLFAFIKSEAVDRKENQNKRTTRLQLMINLTFHNMRATKPALLGFYLSEKNSGKYCYVSSAVTISGYICCIFTLFSAITT